jgi:hypothetical protein
MNTPLYRRIVRQIWIWALLLTLIFGIYPVDYQITRLMFVSGLFLTWLGACVLGWQCRKGRIALLLVGLLAALTASLPGRAVNPQHLAEDYCRSLRFFDGVRYVWGGEGILGIDCSGLVRKGLVWGQLYHGFRTLNGQPIRAALDLWWHDSSALALRDGYRGWTTTLFPHGNIAEANHTLLRPGDLAVTSDGVHIMAYLGTNTWIEADPSYHKVLTVTLPTDNPWFKRPVVFLRWKWLMTSPRNPESEAAKVSTP